MTSFDHIHSGLSLHLGYDCVLVGAIVQKAGADVDGVDGLTHGRHPGLQVHQPQDRRGARTPAAVKQAPEFGIRTLVSFEFALFFVKTHETAMTRDTRLVLDVLATQHGDIHSILLLPAALCPAPPFALVPTHIRHSAKRAIV
jgi:hypothetical protein